MSKGKRHFIHYKMTSYLEDHSRHHFWNAWMRCRRPTSLSNYTREFVEYIQGLEAWHPRSWGQGSIGLWSKKTVKISLKNAKNAKCSIPYLAFPRKSCTPSSLHGPSLLEVWIYALPFHNLEVRSSWGRDVGNNHYPTVPTLLLKKCHM